MRNWVITLAITTVAFAGSTLWLARELSLERSRPVEVAAAPAAVPEPVTPGLESLPPRPAKSAAAEEPKAAVVTQSWGSAWVLGPEELRQSQMDYSKRLLAQLADPEQREELLAQHKMMMRHSFPGVAQVLGLSAEEYNRFLELNALEQLDMQADHARCAVNPDCEPRDMYRQGPAARQSELAELLGEQRAQKFETYKSTMGEREAVNQLRARLADSQRLPDDRAEQLVTALAAEREVIHREILQGGHELQGYGVGAGMIFVPDDGSTLEQHYQIARRNSQRLRDRAAPYLTPEQQRAFDDMQEETLLGLRSALRQKEQAAGTFGAVTVTR